MKSKESKNAVFWCLFCVSIVTTIMLFVFLVDTVNKIYQVQRIKQEGKYLVEKFISFSGGLTSYDSEYPKRASYEEENKKLMELSNVEDLMLCVWCECRYGDSSRDAAIEVILNDSIPKFPLCEGQYDVEEEGVYIGQGFIPFLVEERGNKYLLINNEYYKVNGIFEDNTGDQSDQRIFIYNQHLSTRFRTKVLDSVFPFLGSFSIYSDYEDVGPSMEIILGWIDRYYYKELEQYGVELEQSIDNRGDAIGENNFFVSVMIVLVVLMIGFCYYSVLLSSKLWIRKYQRDLVVLKAFGLGRFGIVRYFYGKLLKIYGMAFVFMLIWFHNIVAFVTLGVAFALIVGITIVPLLKVLNGLSIRNLVEVIEEV